MRQRRRRIVIVGGGFAGLHVVRHLEKRLRKGEAEVTLVDRVNYHLFTPLLYQVATGELPEHAVAYPLRRSTAPAGYAFRLAEVEAVDAEARTIRTADGAIPYDHLVLAPGSVTQDFGIPGVREHAIPMKTADDARAFKRHILRCFERAAATGDAVARRRLLTFVIVGAGPVGVELAASLRDLVDHTLAPMYPGFHRRRDVHITLVDGGERVIAGMHPRLSALAQRRLDALGVRTLLRTFVSEARDGLVMTKDGARLDAGTVAWAGGVRTHPLVSAVEGVPHAKDGRLVVDRTFRVGGRDDLFSLGDAAVLEVQGKPLAQLAQVAVLEAPYVAANLARLVRGEPLAEYVHHPKGDLIALGRTSAGAHMRRFGPIPTGDLVFGGLPAWTVWRTNYLLQLLGVRNRATLLAEWTLSFFLSRMVADT
ncbi:MAG TPA: NAD(P)/FAD-dependent oxidoreductase [Candidatus Limnocylindria bacterium]|nr:NAD(P)/FAD-dependent oxidoreductase [Candidatus Limnocylindria bacterium]